MQFRVSRRFPQSGETEPEERVKESESRKPPAASEAAGAPGATGVPPVVVPRWVQLVILPLALLGLWALARAAGSVLLILVAASIVGLILNPLIKQLQRRGLPRGLAILLVYLALFAILAGVGLLLSDPVSTQVSRFADRVPTYVKHANHDLDDLQRWLDRRGIKVQIQQQGQTALQTLEKHVLKSSGNIVSFSRDALGKIATISFDLVLVLILSVYLLVYGGEIGGLVRRVMPPGDGTPADDFPLMVQRAVFGYVRGQLLFSLIMGASAALLLWLLGVVGIFPAGERYALFFGGFYGLMELIPYIGPIIGALPAVLVALFNDPISAVWVVLAFIALQQLEGHFIAPQVFRISLRINPIVIILALLIGYQLYGIAGALLALPVTSVVRETIIYLRRHLVFELWEAAGPGAGLVVPRAGARGPEEGVAREPGADPPGADAAPEPENGVSEPEYPVPSRVDPR